MSKVIRLIKNISSFILVFVTTFLVGYTLFISCKDIIPLPVYIEVRRIYTTVLTIIIIVSFPVLAVSSFSRIFRILFSLLLIPFCCFFSFISINMPEKILNTTKLESYYYHISIKGALDDISTRTIYTLYKCDIDNLSCQKIFYDVYNSIEPVSLRKNEEEKEIYFFRNDNLLFVDGGQPHEILTNKQFGDFIYYLGVYPPYGSSSELEYKYILYKCDLSFVGCRQLPFYYTDTGGNFSLLFDEELKQLKLYKLQFNDENVLNQNVEDDILIYTLDEEPKCYVERCDVPSG